MSQPTFRITVTMPLEVWRDSEERRAALHAARTNGMPRIAAREGMVLTGWPQSEQVTYMRTLGGQLVPTDPLDADSVEVLLVAPAWPKPKTDQPPV